jgi:hypothetical protein
MGVFGATPNGSAISPPSAYADPGQFGAAGNGTTDDVAALNAIATQASGSQVTVLVYKPLAVSSYSPPANIAFQFVPGGYLKRLSGSITFNNNSLIAGSQKILDDGGNAGVITGTPKIPFSYASWFGAKADNSTDATAALQSIARFAADAGYIRIYMDPGTYKISSTIYANGANSQSFYTPSWIGCEAYQGTLIDGSAIAGTNPLLYFRGASGRKQSGYIESIGFIGVAGSTIALQIQGVNGFRARRCQFFAQLDAVRLANLDAGSFTEYVTLEDCGINPSVTTAAHYKVTSGDSSFHGSGLTGRSVVSASTTGPVVQIDNGSNIYNAPFNAQIFAGNSCSLFQNDNVTLPSSAGFAGEITVEMSGGTLTLGSGARIFFAGPIRANGLTNATGANVVSGTLARVDTMAVYPDGSYSYSGANTNQLVSLTTGGNTIASLIAGTCRLMNVNISASNYNYRYILAVDPDGSGGSGFVSTVATLRQFNTAGYNAPTFSVDTSGRLIITNANYPASGVTAYVTESQISAGIQGGGHMQF